MLAPPDVDRLATRQSAKSVSTITLRSAFAKSYGDTTDIVTLAAKGIYGSTVLSVAIETWGRMRPSSISSLESLFLVAQMQGRERLTQGFWKGWRE